MRKASHIEELRQGGFDLSTYDRSSGHHRVRCSQCQAVVINGVPCHEAGCPNYDQAKRREREEEWGEEQ